MKVLVTGGAGFIGSHVVEELLNSGHEVAVLDDFSTGRHENLVGRDVQLIERKIQYEDPRQHRGYGAVFHIAAKARIQPSIRKPLSFDSANVHGTLAALEIARRCEAKFIFSSSSSVYGPTEQLPTRETEPTNPQNPYALQKLIGEQYAKLYGDLHGTRWTALRYFNVYGERMVPEGSYATAIAIFEDQKKRGVPLTIVGDGTQRRDFTYVKDVVAANMIALEHPDTDGQIFNVGAGDNKSVNEIAAAIAGPEYPREMLGDRPGEVPATLADNAKLRSYGWAPSVDVINWLEKRHV